MKYMSNRIEVIVGEMRERERERESEDFTCFGQPTRLITCARTHGPDKALM